LPNNICVAIDLDSNGSFVILDTDGALIEYGGLKIPAQPRKGESDSAFRGRKYAALKDIVRHGKEVAANLGVNLTQVFSEESDWHRPIYPGCGKPYHTSDLQAGSIIDKQNRMVSRALGRLEGYIHSACIELCVEYTPIPVHEAKYAITSIAGKKDVSKKAVQRVVMGLCPQITTVEPTSLRESVCDAFAVGIAGLGRSDPLIPMRIKAK
jgi:hypothetical protein